MTGGCNNHVGTVVVIVFNSQVSLLFVMLLQLQAFQLILLHHNLFDLSQVPIPVVLLSTGAPDCAASVRVAKPMACSHGLLLFFLLMVATACR
jgi:hypothetical protein